MPASSECTGIRFRHHGKHHKRKTDYLSANDGAWDLICKDIKKLYIPLFYFKSKRSKTIEHKCQTTVSQRYSTHPHASCTRKARCFHESTDCSYENTERFS